MTTHETFVPTVMLSYINVSEGGRTKPLLHQLWVSEFGNTDWRRVPIRKNEKTSRVETLVFNDAEWDDDGRLRPGYMTGVD